MTINDAEYYESNTATVSDAQVYFTSNNETISHTSNRICEQKLLSFRTIPVFPLPMNLGRTAIRLTPHMILMPSTKEIYADAASGGAWTHRNPWHVSWTGVNGSIPGNIGNFIGILETSYAAMIEIIGTDPLCGLTFILKVGNIRQFTSP